MSFVKVANFFAKIAAPHWCEVRPVQSVCRWAYCTIMETPSRISRQQPACANHDTYPYRDHRFAPWAKHCLVPDGRGVAIRQSVSYVLHKYHEALGKDLLLFDGGEHVNDVKNWHKVMDLNLKLPIEQNFAEYLREYPERRSGYYIGVSPSEDLLYWYEGVEDKTNQIYISTYFKGKYSFTEFLPIEIKAGYITWYKVS